MQFNIITTEPSEEINKFHHRMPVILPLKHIEKWRFSSDPDEIIQLMTPYTEPLLIYECDAYVDNGRHEGVQCMEPRKHQFKGQ